MRTTSGYDWIRRSTRLAIYARDGWRCIVCGKPQGERRRDRLSLDHVDGPSNAPANLITACVSCNSSHSGIPLLTWRPELRARVETQLARPIDRAAARQLCEALHGPRMQADRRRARRGPVVVEGVPF